MPTCLTGRTDTATGLVCTAGQIAGAAVQAQEGGTTQRGSTGRVSQVLPDAPGTVLQWPPEDVRSLLAGSGLAAKAADILGAADGTWRELAPVVAEAEARGVAEKGMFTGVWRALEGGRRGGGGAGE